MQADLSPIGINAGMVFLPIATPADSTIRREERVHSAVEAQSTHKHVRSEDASHGVDLGASVAGGRDAPVRARRIQYKRGYTGRIVRRVLALSENEFQGLDPVWASAKGGGIYHEQATNTIRQSGVISNAPAMGTPIRAATG